MVYFFLNLVKKIRYKLNTFFWKSLGLNIEKKSIVFPGFESDNPKNVAIGMNTMIYKNVTMYSSAGSISIGKESHVAPYCYFLFDEGKIEIGDFVAVGAFTTFIGFSNYYDSSGRGKKFVELNKSGEIKIGSNVFIGTHSVILADTIIENDVIVAAGSVVSGNLESGWIYGGVPVKKIKRVWNE